MGKDDHYMGALLEGIQSRIQRMAEAMADVPKDVRELKEDVAELKTDVKAVKAAIRDQGEQVNNHEDRIVTLETQTV